jgi:hypothetical protein
MFYGRISIAGRSLIYRDLDACASSGATNSVHLSSGVRLGSHILSVALANEAGFMKGVGWEKGG